MNISIISIIQSGKYFTSPFLSRNFKQLSFHNSRFYLFSHELLYNSFPQKSSLTSLTQSHFFKFLSPVVTFNRAEISYNSETFNQTLDFQNNTYSSVTFSKCTFENMEDTAIILGNQKLEITSSTFQSCHNGNQNGCSCIQLGSNSALINTTLFDSNDSSKNVISDSLDNSIKFELFFSNFTKNVPSSGQSETGSIIEIGADTLNIDGCFFDQPSEIKTDFTIRLIQGDNTIQSTIFYQNTLPIQNEVKSSLNTTICIFSKTDSASFSIYTTAKINVYQCCFDRNYSLEISDLSLATITQSSEAIECKLTATPYWVTDDSITIIRRELTYIVYYSIFCAIVFITLGLIIFYTKNFLKKLKNANDEEPLKDANT